MIVIVLPNSLSDGNSAATQWSPSLVATNDTYSCVQYSEVSLSQGLLYIESNGILDRGKCALYNFNLRASDMRVFLSHSTTIPVPDSSTKPP